MIPQPPRHLGDRNYCGNTSGFPVNRLEKIVGSPHLTVPRLSFWKAVAQILSRGPCIVLSLCKWRVSTNLRSCRNY